jgi:hypothetical protein
MCRVISLANFLALSSRNTQPSTPMDADAIGSVAAVEVPKMSAAWGQV